MWRENVMRGSQSGRLRTYSGQGLMEPPDERESHETWDSEVDRRSPDYIRWLQQSLNRILGTRLAVDGVSGRQTRSAICDFQRRHGLAVDGVVGSRTEAALIAAGARPPPGGGPMPPMPVGPTPPPRPPPGGSRPCPVTSPGFARDRCRTPGTLPCPSIPDLLCVSDVGGLPFEYPTSISPNFKRRESCMA